MSSRFYYGPNDWTDGSPDLGRFDGVQAILQNDPYNSWYVESHGDYYVYKEDSLWHAADKRGVITEGLKRGDMRRGDGLFYEILWEGAWIVTKNDLVWERWVELMPWVLYGETLGNIAFQETFQQALAEMTLRRQGND